MLCLYVNGRSVVSEFTVMRMMVVMMIITELVKAPWSCRWCSSCGRCRARRRPSAKQRSWAFWRCFA